MCQIVTVSVGYVESCIIRFLERIFQQWKSYFEPLFILIALPKASKPLFSQGFPKWQQLTTLISWTSPMQSWGFLITRRFSHSPLPVFMSWCSLHKLYQQSFASWENAENTRKIQWERRSRSWGEGAYGIFDLGLRPTSRCFIYWNSRLRSDWSWISI